MKKSLLITAGVASLLSPGLVYGYMNLPHLERKLPGRKTIACIGDSITFGAGVLLGRKNHAWPYILEAMLGEDYQVVNYGISGATMLRSGDLPYFDLFLRNVEEMDTQAVILMLGTNDSKERNWDPAQFPMDYAKMLDRLIAKGKKICIMLPPKAFPSARTGIVGFGIRNEIIEEEILATIRNLAEAYRLPLIDLYSATQDHPEYFNDGVHPNRFGNQAIAHHIFEQWKLIGE